MADKLEALIAADEFGVGSQLPSEKELMARFGVGRPSVREALFLLQQQGLVDITSGARARVTAPPTVPDRSARRLVKRGRRPARARTNMEQTRLLFEAGVAWQAAQVATEEDIVRLQDRRSMPTSPRSANTAEFIRTDVAFHYELDRITRNPVLTAVHEILVEWLIDQRTTTIHMPEADSLSVRDHTAIYEAVARTSRCGHSTRWPAISA